MQRKKQQNSILFTKLFKPRDTVTASVGQEQITKQYN